MWLGTKSQWSCLSSDIIVSLTVKLSRIKLTMLILALTSLLRWSVGGVVTEVEIEDQVKRNKQRTVFLDNRSRHLTLMKKN